MCLNLDFQNGGLFVKIGPKIVFLHKKEKKILKLKSYANFDVNVPYIRRDNRQMDQQLILQDGGPENLSFWVDIAKKFCLFFN